MKTKKTKTIMDQYWLMIPLFLFSGCQAATPLAAEAPRKTENADELIVFEAHGQAIITDDSPMGRMRAREAAGLMARGNLLATFFGKKVSDKTSVDGVQREGQVADLDILGKMPGIEMSYDQKKDSQIITAVATYSIKKKDLYPN